jgi:hypothetical protein
MRHDEEEEEEKGQRLVDIVTLVTVIKRSLGKTLAKVRNANICEW